jgi:hypothetical protein
MTSTNPTVCQAARHIESGEIAGVAAEQRGIDTGEIVAHAVIERTTKRRQKRIENGAVELGWAVIGGQRIEAVGGAGLDLFAVMRGEMAERRSCLGVDIGAGGEPERQAQLLEIILVRQCHVLVEPFWRQQLGGATPLRTAVGKFDTRAHKALRRLGERHHTEPERHTQVDVSFVETNLANGEEGRIHVAAARSRSAVADRVQGSEQGLKTVRYASVMRIPRIGRRPTQSLFWRNFRSPDNFARADLTR